MDRRNLALGRTNFILLGIGFAIVVIGFILMSGEPSTEQAYNADIFSARRIKVAPVVCFIGFISMIYAVIRKPKHHGGDDTIVPVTDDAKNLEKAEPEK
jgi:hypothetical protein